MQTEQEERTSISKEREERLRLENLPFAELTSEQKIDRLVTIIRSFEYTTNRVYALESKMANLERHSHSEQGLVVVPIGNNMGLNGGMVTGSAKLAGRHPLD